LTVGIYQRDHIMCVGDRSFSSAVYDVQLLYRLDFCTACIKPTIVVVVRPP